MRGLLREGFLPSEIGFAGPGVAGAPVLEGIEGQDAGLLGATASGSLAGGVVGGVLGAVVAGLMPGIGPVVAGGVLAGVVAGATTGGAVAGIAAALSEVGLPGHLADFYEAQVRAGRFLVTVGGDRSAAAEPVIARCGGLLEGRLGRTVSRLTGTDPVFPEVVEGEFASPEVAELVAERLQEAFPDRWLKVDVRDRRVRAGAWID